MIRPMLCRSPALLLAAALAAAGCSDRGQDENVVVVYTAHDRVLSEPILQEFQKQTGITVKPVYDSESSKTTGLVERLIARRNNPDCDVFWNNEIVQTIRLANEGILAEYVSPEAARFPERCRDRPGRWTAFAARARLLIYNTDLIAPGGAPSGLADFVDSKWRGKAAIARPFYGTTLTHFALLYRAWGADRLAEFCRGLRGNEVALCVGNGPVRDQVADGERAFGLTDTDDAYAAILDGRPVAVKIPDAGGLGVVLIPNTVALVANCPHPAAGRKLIDFLLSARVERALAAGRAAQIPLATDLAGVKTPWDELLTGCKIADADFQGAAAAIKDVVELLQRERMDQ